MRKKTVVTIVTILVVLIMAPSGVDAQVGNCYYCDYDMVQPCTGTHHGADNCQSQSPDHCDVYGGECHSGGYAATILPDGSPSSTGVDALLADFDASAAEAAESENRIIRGCKGEALLRIPTPEVAQKERVATAVITI